MSTTGGLVYKDLLPIPDDTQAVSDPHRVEIAQTMREEPTASHALAQADHDLKGASQVAHDAEVVDLGWHEPAEAMAKPLVGGLPNDELWILVRRFNKQMYHVKEYPHPVPGNLDLNIADEEEFSPDKLRANIERLYMTIGLGMMSFGNHIVRLRSWREKRRTAVFCTAYFAAWILDLIVPLIITTLITLIVYPPSRDIMFPPAPIALVSSKGGVQKPKAGVLGSTDTATGAPENHKGEAQEAEAQNFVNSIAQVALASASGKHPQNEPPSEDGSPHDSVPDPTSMAASAGAARAGSAGKTGHHPASDKTKVPMETAMWTKMRPIMHGLADVTDTWERFGNALSPTPPFPEETYRLRLAGLVVPLLGVSIFVTSYMFTKGATFGVGFGFFGDPIITPGAKWLNRTFPHWQKMLEIRNTILKGVPTNAQLTLTLLRIGEANKAPLPPPPHTSEPPPDQPADITDEHLRATGADWPLNATQEELDAAMQHDPTTAHQTGGADIDHAKDSKHGKKGQKIMAFFKGTVKGTIETAMGADHLKAKVGSEHAKNRLGVIPDNKQSELTGPVDFSCRYHGKRGHIYISTKATIPCVSFSLDSKIAKQGSLNRDEGELHPVWSIPVGDVRELKKVGGLGWKAKLVVGWALNREIADGIEIVSKTGETWNLTAMVLRDELFNRLVAMGGQKWESW